MIINKIGKIWVNVYMNNVKKKNYFQVNVYLKIFKQFF